MRLTLLLLGAGGCVLGIAAWLTRYFGKNHVSEAWLTDHDRRQWGIGYEGICWRWPVNKMRNDAGRFNAAQLRKRA